MRCVVVFLFALLLTSPLPGLRLTPLPEVVSHPAGGQSLDHDSLVQLSLVLSGVTPQAVPAYQAVLEEWSTQFKAQIDPSWDEAKKAEELLLALHSHLKAYSFYQTQLDVLIDRGTFNCVSSALAYMILGRDIGLDVEAAATPDHAFALVRLASGRNVDVETTTKFGFDPGTKTEFTNSFGQTGFVYVPPGNYAQRRSIGDRQLLGLLLQNRMANDQEAGQAEETVGLAIDRWTLEGTPEAFRTLIDCFVNEAAALNSRKDYQKGLELIDKMVVWTGPVADAKQLAWAFVNNQVSVLLDRGDFDGAQALTDSWKSRGLLTETQVSQLMAVVVDNRLTHAVKTQAASDVAPQVNQAAAQGLITQARRAELLSVSYGQEVQKLEAEKGPQAAWSLVKSLPKDIQSLPALVEAARVFEYNWGVLVHNQFVRLWNAGKRDEARRLLKDSLDTDPANTMLKKDWAQVQSQAN